MGLEYRIDAASTLKSPIRTEQGFLRCEGLVARPGIYEYEDPKMPGGKRRELRPRDVLFDPVSMAGYQGAPIIVNHVAKVTPGNVRRFEVGTVLAARQDGDAVANDMIIKDGDAIKGVESGKKQLSPGHLIEYDPTPGVDAEFGRYDGVQRKIKINHVAIVDFARGGEQMQIRLDGVSEPIAIEIDKEQAMKPEKPGEKPNEEARNDGDAANAETVRTLRETIADLQRQLADANRTLESERITAANTRADGLQAELETTRAAMTAAAQARAAMIVQAQAIVGPTFDALNISDHDLRGLVVKKLRPNDNIAAMSPAALTARYDSLVEVTTRSRESLSAAAAALIGGKPQIEARADESREAKRKAWREQWKQPLPSVQGNK